MSSSEFCVTLVFLLFLMDGDSFWDDPKLSVNELCGFASARARKSMGSVSESYFTWYLVNNAITSGILLIV